MRAPNSEISLAEPILRTPATSGFVRWTSKMLLDGAREIIIEHAGVEYRLRLTNQDKLILTK